MNWLLLILFIPGGLNRELGQNVLGPATFSVAPCDDFRITFVRSPITGRRNQYSLQLSPLPHFHVLYLKFNSEVTLELKQPKDSANLRIQKFSVPKNTYRIDNNGTTDYIEVQVFGPASGTIPYVQSIIADYDRELCENPKIGILDYLAYIREDDAIEEEKNTEEINTSVYESCGRRKVLHTVLILHGELTKSGDWPWHVAILRIEKSSLRYICGGTLLSKTLVLTAAHCASLRGNAVVPDVLSVDLGKHNLIGDDIGAQKREVFKVIIHPEFDGNTLNNDIALLKLKSEAVFTDYVQPACLRHEQANDKLPVTIGTVVGWGFDDQDLLSFTLQQLTVPIVSELTCLKSNPLFFHRKLNTNKFCAGFANGTSVCNGDSGGGLMIFVPDRADDTDKETGAWYVRGIVSLSPSRTDANICDPYQYTIFTDVEKYRDWLLEYMN